MGYVRKRRLYELDFSGTSLDGLIVVMKGMTIGESIELSKLRELENAEEEKQLEKTEELLLFVVGKIDSWNLEEEDGGPIKPSVEELKAWDAGDFFLALGRWQEAVMDVPAPLEQRSNGGTRQEVPSLPPLPMPN